MENITPSKTRFISLHGRLLTPEYFKQIPELGVLDEMLEVVMVHVIDTYKEQNLLVDERKDEVVAAFLNELKESDITIHGYVNYFWDESPEIRMGHNNVESKVYHFLLECGDKLYRERIWAEAESYIYREEERINRLDSKENRDKNYVQYRMYNALIRELRKFGQIILASIILFLYIFGTSSLTAQTTKQMTHEQLADEYYKSGLAAARKIKPDTSAALYHFSQVIALNPRHAPAAKWLSWVYEQMHNDVQALYHISRYLSLEQSDAKAYFRRAIIYIRLNRYTEAFADFSEAVRLAENEQDKGVFLEYRANLFDTLAAADRRVLNNLQQQRTIQQEGR